ncbi:MAG: glycine cleavage T C-terminal barrel domain-containing protein [Planctomycetota bacterium]
MEATATPLEDLFKKRGASFREIDGVLLPFQVKTDVEEMNAATEGLFLTDGGDRAWIEMQGADAADFLQRILTSDVKKLQPGEGQWSAMLDGKGHWISDLLVYALPTEDSIPRFGLDMPTCRLAVVLQKLEMMHFSEDLQWQTPLVGRLLLLGMNASGDPIPMSAQAASDGWILQRPDRGADCMDRIVAADKVEAVAKTMLKGGAKLGGWMTLEQLRIEARRPRWGVDFDEETTLPVSNEWHRSSITKGCYAGQEIIAKINTYGEAPRQLCHLEFADDETNLQGAELQNEEGRKMGKVTSWAWSWDDKVAGAVGMGILRRRAAVEGGEVFAVVEGEGDKRIPVKVHLPEKIFG